MRGEIVQRNQQRKGAFMHQKKFEEIIQFAIQREIESMDFYDRASKLVKHSGTRDLFMDFMKQEEGHKKKLEAARVGKIELGKIEKIPNLKISDYMVEAELKPEISYAEILRIAMKREERSVKLYTDLNEKNRDETFRNLFTFLIQEESKHKYSIEKLYDDEVLK
jgi:rubrerythrin